MPDCKTQEAILATIKTLNPQAQVKFTTNCKVSARTSRCCVPCKAHHQRCCRGYACAVVSWNTKPLSHPELEIHQQFMQCTDVHQAIHCHASGWYAGMEPAACDCRQESFTLPSVLNSKLCPSFAAKSCFRSLSLAMQQVPLTDILNTGNFDMEKASTAPGWLHSLRSSKPVASETVEFGITSFVYRYFLSGRHLLL